MVDASYIQKERNERKENFKRMDGVKRLTFWKHDEREKYIFLSGREKIYLRQKKSVSDSIEKYENIFYKDWKQIFRGKKKKDWTQGKKYLIQISKSVLFH